MSPPAQVAAADALFAREPRGSEALLTSVDPAAACVAAAHWLSAAARITGRIAEAEASDVFAESDDINACSIHVPQLVVEAVLDLEQAPRDIVLQLLTDATEVREGKIPDLERLLAQVDEAHLEAEAFPESRRAEVLEALLPDRITPLDPQRPARDLLEHLLDGLGASLTLFYSSIDIDDDGAPMIDGERIPHPDGIAWNVAEDDYDDPEYLNARYRALDREFSDRVRDEAALTHARLT